MANKKGNSLLVVMADVPAAAEEDFNGWYNVEHLPELIELPGVLNAARYEAVGGGLKHLACYELEAPDVLDSYLKTRVESEWMQRSGPRYVATAMSGSYFQMIYPRELTDDIAQGGMAPALYIERTTIQPRYEDEWNSWCNEVYLPTLEKVPGCIRVRRWQAVNGWPKYMTLCDLEDEGVFQASQWSHQLDSQPENARIRALATHAWGTPGIWRRTFSL